MNVQFHGFQDVRGVTVLSPTVDLTQDYTERTNLRVNYGLDTISAASDSCVRCHRDGVNSHRQVFGLSATRKYNDLKLTIGGAYSKENFYRATTGLASVSRDLANGNTTVAGGFSFSLNQPMLHPLPEYENQYQSGGFVSVTQTLTKSTIAQAGYEISHITGYQNNPYLRADVNGMMVLGHVPDAADAADAVRAAAPGAAGRHVPRSRLPAVHRRLGGEVEHLQRRAVALLPPGRLCSRSRTAATIRRAPSSGRRSTRAPRSTTRRTSGSSRSRRTRTREESRSRRRDRGGCCRRARRFTVQYERYSADNGFDAAIVSTGLRVPLKVINR